MSRSGEDWISFLPDPLLCQILSDLPTKTAVTTSVLSKRWAHLCLSVPILDLDIYDFPGYTTFTSFVSRFLDFSKESRLHMVKLAFKRQQDDGDDLSLLTSWIETAVLRKIQHLEIDCRMSFTCEMMPLSLYLCKTLVSLRLHYVALLSFESVSLPNLKTMHLEENLYDTDEVLENLISSCPVLESLTVVRNFDETVKVLRVRSTTLKSLKLVLDSSKSWYNDDSDDWEVLIDAPRLEHLSLETTLKIICQYMNFEPVPCFPNMIRLQTELYMESSLLKFLESFPNLQTLILKQEGVRYGEHDVLIDTKVFTNEPRVC